MELPVGPLLLRPVRTADLPVLRALLTDPRLMAHALHDRAFTPDEADGFLCSAFAGMDDVCGMHVVSIAATDTVIGFSGYRRCHLLDVEDVEFGWVLHAAHHGRGYATALGEALILHGRAALKLKRVLAACHPANAASEHVLRDKLHMRFEREVTVTRPSRRRVYVKDA
ncbi:MAG TPA: GNAT family N-acetyltransferase [Vicinamibacterales bacterium]|nr:GNAT family N-acetyltransferase [Vicinamibacterales bacterium]